MQPMPSHPKLRNAMRCLLAAMLIHSAAAASATEVWLEPVDPATADDPVRLEPGASTLIAVMVRDLPAPGLAAFQLELDFDPQVVMLADPNPPETAAFAPLGDSPLLCEVVRETATCEDPAWFLIGTGRSPLGTSEVDETLGTALIAYGTSGAQALPSGEGALAVIELIAIADGVSEVSFSNLLLADDDEPPSVYASTSLPLAIEVPEPASNALVLAAIATLLMLARSRLRGH